MRLLLALAVAAALSTTFAACGDEGVSNAAAGTPQNPLPAQLDDSRLPDESAEDPEGAAGAGTPSYDSLVADQSAKPRSRFTPCSLVSKSQARSIVGKPVADPLEAPLGPTCVYRSDRADVVVTVAVQTAQLSALKPKLGQAEPVDLDGRRGFCGYHGEPMLYVPVAGGKVLSVGAPCEIAKKFATAAVQRLP